MRKPLPYVVDTAKETRVRVVRLVVLTMFALVIARLFYWQVLQSDRLKAEAESQYNSVSTTNASRGRIFTADGYPLVTNQDVYTVFANPKALSEPAPAVATQLMPFMMQTLDGIDVAQVATDEARRKELETNWTSTLLSKLTTDASWVALKRKLPRPIKDQISSLQIGGLGFDREETRYYPEASMAAQLLGFVGNDDNGNPQGYFGIEGMFDRELRGKEGLLKQEKDAAGLPIALGAFDTIQSQDGRDIVLTIRRDLQFMLEEKLKAGMEKYGSKTAEGVIMDPHTGAILAMASFPQYDPAKFYQYDPQLYKNPIVNDVYEPGSTFKILTVSAGIDAGAVQPDTQCDACSGPMEINGYSIKTWNNKYYPNTTMTAGLIHSDNTAMMFAASKMGKDTFVNYIHSFGLGEKTDVDLQDEALPPLRSDWKDIDAATASFGQGIAVTGIQMARIAQVIANGGVMMRPMLVASVKQGDQTITVQPKEIRRVISKETADKVTQMMISSATYGDAKWALPKGYSIAGKTGTAQVAISGHYDETKTVASFVGFAPADNPKFVMLIKMREPSTSQWGSETAAPLWFSIARDLFMRLDVPPNPSLVPPPAP
ncbi:MAG TPA: penicillin-binding protein 2 [Candidatus Saccharimonadia bacterium]|nr:penicillin-binding protein 2 [Candidatus Saccharimonadia bacterium]